MAHLAVTVALLFLACVHAAPAPEPSKPKFTAVKDSGVGVGAAEGNSNVHGVVQSSKIVETPIEAPVDTGDNVPDVTLADNVNAGGALAGNGGVATGFSKEYK